MNVVIVNYLMETPTYRYTSHNLHYIQGSCRWLTQPATDEILPRIYRAGAGSDVNQLMSESENGSARRLTCCLPDTEDFLTDECIPPHFFPPSAHLFRVAAVGENVPDGRENADQC